MTTTSETLPPADGAMTETAAFEGAIPTRRLPRFRVLFVAFIAALVVVLVASGAGLYAYDRLHSGQIVHGVRVGGIDLSDLDRDAAAARLRDGLAALGQGAVVVNDGVVKQTLTFATLGRGPAIDALLDQAFAVGRTGSIVDRGVDEVRTATRGLGIAPSVAVDATAVATAVAALAADEDRTAVDAAAIATSAGFKVLPGRVGRTVDQAAMTAAIVAALSKTDAPAQIDLDLVSTPTNPAIDDATATARREPGRRDRPRHHGHRRQAIVEDHRRDDPVLDHVRLGRRPVRPARRLHEHRRRPQAAHQGRRPQAQGRDVPHQQAGKVVGVTAGTDGRTLDVAGTVAAVASALQAAGDRRRAEHGGRGRAHLEPAEADDRGRPEAAPLMRQISTWVTYYALRRRTTATAPTSRSRPWRSTGRSWPPAPSSTSGSPSAR